jgi:TPR repeat protein
MKWLEAAATRGHLKAQTALGLKYWEGDIRTHTAPPDHQKSVEWLARAAARGDALAQTYLGYAYIEGKGVPQNDRTAIEWWQKAAQKNESRAEEALGWAYDKGRGVSADLREARRWYSRAKSHGSMGAAGKLNETRFESLAQQDKGLALFLGLLVLGIATAGDTDLPAANASQGCVTPFGTFAHSCDVASDIGWAGIQAGIW